MRDKTSRGGPWPWCPITDGTCSHPPHPPHPHPHPHTPTPHTHTRLQALPTLEDWGLAKHAGGGRLVAASLKEAMKRLDRVWDEKWDFKVGG